MLNIIVEDGRKSDMEINIYKSKVMRMCVCICVEENEEDQMDESDKREGLRRVAEMRPYYVLFSRGKPIGPDRF